jgi:ankyrin repeat protein
MKLRIDDPLAVDLQQAIRTGDLASLERLLGEHPGLATARIDKAGEIRTPLHVATDWPGHFPNGAAVVAALIDAGADPNAPREGRHCPETPLHWVASTDDVEVFDVLVKAGADIEALGGSIGGGTPLDNAVGYGQWHVARRLVACGARTRLWHAAALGLRSRIEACFAADPPPSSGQISEAFYQACCGGQQQTAEFLLDRGADINWIPPWAKGRTPLDAARKEAGGLVDWLLGRGARSAAELN